MQSKAVQGLGSSGTGAEFSGTGAESGGTGGESGNIWGLIKGSRFGSRGAVVEWRPVEVGAGFGRRYIIAGLFCSATAQPGLFFLPFTHLFSQISARGTELDADWLFWSLLQKIFQSQ